METGIIRINETAQTTLQAVTARLHLTVTGENFVYGNAALEKCAELKLLVTELQAAGVEDRDIVVHSVSLETSSGVFARHSKGIYRLSIRVRELAQLSACLSVIAGQKNGRMDSLEWIFEDEEARIEVARRAMTLARKKADAMVGAAGYNIIGIRSCSDSFQVPEQNLNIQFSAPQAESFGKSRARRIESADIGTEFKGEKTITAVVAVDFVIGKAEG